MPNPIRAFSADALGVRVYSTENDLAQAAAHLAIEHIRTTLAQKENAAVILASATSQIRFLDALTSVSDLPWSRVTLFHMDEYLGIPETHPASFRRFMRERVLGRIQPRAFHFLHGDCAEPLKECQRYANLLAAQPVNLCCLGIGENGHIAFNDPPVADFHDPFAVKLVQLDEACRQQQVGEGCFPNLGSVPQYAFTLTIPTLCAAEQMICVVPERRKAVAVRSALEGPVSTACPASWLRRQPHATLFLEPASASLISDAAAL